MSSAESCIDSFLAQARTLSLHLAAPLDSAHVPLTQPCASLRLTHRQGAHILLRMDGKVFGLGRPIITVVQPTQPIMGKHATRGYAANSAPRSLAQHKVRAVFVMVGDVLGK